MLTTLALRHLLVRKRRALFLLFGYGIGAGVMLVLLSIGEAMVVQSQDVALVGGGEITAFPEGIDLEGLRTGAMSGLFFGIDRARFVQRQMLSGPRYRGIVRLASPAIEHKLLYLTRSGRSLPVRAGGEIPSHARGVGAGLPVIAGAWEDSAEDRAFIDPPTQVLYDELDHFHWPPFRLRDSTWGEWHYFNLVTAPEEWWYIAYIVGGDLAGGRWGGELLVSRNRPGGGHDRFVQAVPAAAIRLDTSRADLALGTNTVTQRDGVYQLHGAAQGPAGEARFELTVRPTRFAYFPPIELESDAFLSGYVVPALRATAEGRVCLAGRCRQVAGAPAYHDHNWGVWRGVTWEWGEGRGAAFSLLFGGLQRDSAASGSTPFFLGVVDSMGVRQVLRFARIAYRGARPVPGAPGVRAPEGFDLVAARGPDTLRLAGEVRQAQATEVRAGGLRRYFLQMRGTFRLEGRLTGETVRDQGAGFFETYVK